MSSYQGEFFHKQVAATVDRQKAAHSPDHRVVHILILHGINYSLCQAKSVKWQQTGVLENYNVITLL